MVSPQLIRDHLQDQVEDLALHRSQYNDLSHEDWLFFLQQIEGYQRTADKLPLFGEMAKRRDGEGWWYPPRISCEQCSSEATARYKAELLRVQNAQCTMQNGRLVDLTGGAGVDTYFLSERFDTVDYVEPNADLCRLAQHNLPAKVSVHNCSAEQYLDSPIHRFPDSPIHQFTDSTTIFIDPSRRDHNGGKVFRLADCTPNVVALLPQMRAVADTILIKLSPMLDISQALRELGGDWQVHVVSVKNEVKEVLFVHHAQGTMHHITCVDLAEDWQFCFTREEEQQATSQLTDSPIHRFTSSYLYEPCAAILKAGAYKLVGARYGLNKLGVNTHLYVSDHWVEHFPGRCWRILGEVAKGFKGEKANVLTRNYPLSAEQLKQKLRITDGGDRYIIGTRIGHHPTLLLCAILY